MCGPEEEADGLDGRAVAAAGGIDGGGWPLNALAGLLIELGNWGTILTWS